MNSNDIDFLFDEYISKARKEKRRNKKIINIVIIVVAVFTMFQLIGIGRVNSATMEPNYNKGNIIVYEKLTKDFEKNDIIVINYEGHIIIRRVIGVSGDHIDIDNTKGTLVINGVNETSQYTQGLTVTDPTGIKFPLYVSDNYYFVLCDNRSNTADSRKIGCINKSNIIGKVIISI